MPKLDPKSVSDSKLVPSLATSLQLASLRAGKRRSSIGLLASRGCPCSGIREGINFFLPPARPCWRHNKFSSRAFYYRRFGLLTNRSTSRMYTLCSTSGIRIAMMITQTCFPASEAWQANCIKMKRRAVNDLIELVNGPWVTEQP